MGAKSIELLATAFKSAIGELLFCIEGAAVAAPRLRASIKPLQLRLQRLKVIAHPLPNACTQFVVWPQLPLALAPRMHFIAWRAPVGLSLCPWLTQLHMTPCK